MSPDRCTAKDIFVELVSNVPPEQWENRLEESCQGNDELRNHVRALLRAHAEPGSFLEQPAVAADATILQESPISERPGTIIGPYKLLQQIGEGGMGVVFMAEQTEPIQRTVALKIIKPGMDSRKVIARFEAERQALAMMDHPNIARVIDAGTTEAGRPYFIMDLVKGVPITEYCDQQYLSVRERLELMSQVCHAVQHAHQKGIIHRDIKPSNVLVAEYDGKPVPKIIDFGVAKATAQKRTERTMFTEFGQVIGTVEYMSPEQARFNQLDVDTRSDIYSLGVLLYELLTGSTPFERKRLREAAFDEVLRIIREEEPPKPSTRLTTAEQLPSIAAQRGLEPKALSGIVKGELDWIVMKALEKDRSRRYETASGLASDIEHYLHDEPVQAYPPSGAYRLRKFARRYKGPLAAAATLSAVLMGAIVFSTWQAVRATRAERLAESRLRAETKARREANAERHRADAEAKRAVTEAASASAINQFLIRDLLGQMDMYIPFDRYQQPRDELTLKSVLDRAAKQLDGRFGEQPLVEASLRATIGDAYAQLGHPGEGTVYLRRALDLRKTHLGEEHPTTLSNMVSMGWMTNDGELIARALDVRRRTLGNHHPDTLSSLLQLALFTVHRTGNAARAIELFREAVQTSRAAVGEQHPSTAWSMHLLAATLAAHSGNPGVPQADDREIESLFRHALAVTRKAHDNSWNTYDIRLRLGQFLSSRHRYEEAEAVFKEGLARLQALPGAPPESAAEMARELRTVYVNWGKPGRVAELDSQAAAADESALARYVRLLRDRPSDSNLWVSYASLLLRIGRLGEAEAAYRAAIRLRPDESVSHHGLGVSQACLGQWHEAAASMNKALQLSTDDLLTQVKAAALCAYTGDRENYRRSCTALLDSFGRTDNMQVADNVVKACSLAPGSGADIQQVLKLADSAAFKKQTGTAREWFELARAMAHYRAGDFTSAAEIITGSVPLHGMHRDASALSIVAMARHRQGKSDAARAALADAKKIIAAKMPRTEEGQTFGDDWHDWLHAQTLCREAEELLGVNNQQAQSPSSSPSRPSTAPPAPVLPTARASPP